VPKMQLKLRPPLEAERLREPDDRGGVDACVRSELRGGSERREAWTPLDQVDQLATLRSQPRTGHELRQPILAGYERRGRFELFCRTDAQLPLGHELLSPVDGCNCTNIAEPASLQERCEANSRRPGLSSDFGAAASAGGAPEWPSVPDVRLGFLSTGNIADQVARSLSTAAGITLVAVASRSRGRAEAFAERHGATRAYGLYDQLLADPDIDAVYIPLPNSLHLDWSTRAIRAGKHVLCEKPFSSSGGAAETAYALADEADLVLAEAFMYRHNPWVSIVSKLLEDGRIGELSFIRAVWTTTLTRSDHIALRPELEGGVLMALGCYCVSAGRLFGGEPERVYGERVLAPTGVDMSFGGALRAASGVMTQFWASLAAPERHELELVGSDGCISVADPWYGRAPVITIGSAAGELTELTPPAADPYRIELEAFARAIDGEAPPVPGPDETVGQARAIEALLRSAAAAAPVML
jgi:xylose dehydrogenase (NAD/NADP)